MQFSVYTHASQKCCVQPAIVQVVDRV